MRQLAGLATAVAISVGFGAGAGPASAQDRTLAVWSHFADHEGVRLFLRDVEEKFGAENPERGADLDDAADAVSRLINCIRRDTLLLCIA